MSVSDDSARVVAPVKAASALLEADRNSLRFTLGSAALDRLVTPPDSATLGLPTGHVLELIGPAGIGKTRAALSCVVLNRFQSLFDDTDHQVLVVDAEGSLSAPLINETARLFAEHNSLSSTIAEEACRGIRIQSVDSLVLLIAWLRTISSWLSHHPQVKLLVIDSLTNLLRPSTLDARTLVFELLASTFRELKLKHEVAVLLTCSMSIKMFDGAGNPSSWSRDAEGLLVPITGEGWLSVPHTRVVMYHSAHGERRARLLSSTTAQTGASQAVFTIDTLGVCDVPDEANGPE